MKHHLIKLSLVTIAIFAVSTAELQTARAQTAAPTPAQRQAFRAACGADVQSLCARLTGKDARMCLRAHHAQLSPGCTAFMKEAQARRAAGAMAPAPAGGAPPPSVGGQ